MAASFQQVIILGSVGQDPDVKVLPSGDSICNLSVATSKSWTDKNSGQKKEKTEWHRVVMFGKLAEITGQYVRKGSQIMITGELETREWEKDGVKRYTTEIKASDMKMVGARPEGTAPAAGRDSNNSAPRQQASAPRQQAAAPQQQRQAPPVDDDIPF